MGLHERYQALAHRIRQAMRDDSLRSDEAFNELALAIFEFQITYNEPYHNYCRQLGQTKPDHWTAIPSVPTDAFKQGRPISCFPEADCCKVFLTSGTTNDLRGRHYFRETSLYEDAVRRCWAALPWNETLPTFVLTPSPAVSPQSSLSHMMGVITGLAEDRYFVDPEGTLHAAALRDVLKMHVEEDQPVLLLGTALAFLHLFNDLADTVIHLAEGSWAMETGGYKGYRITLTKPELYRQFETALSLPPTHIVNEYSMTELSSQFYSRGLDTPHHGPSWTRFVIREPSQHQPVAKGETGYLTLVDLANLNSVIAIATQDLATPRGDGFVLSGRDPQAIERGCSRAIDAMLSARNL